MSDIIVNKDGLVVGHSEATVNTFEYRGIQVGEFNGNIKVEIQDGTNPPAPKAAMRFTANKLRFDLLPIEPLIELTRVYDSGALKYDDNNWRKGMPWSQVIRPIFSHLFKWLLGQKIDKETGCHHLMMVAWNCFTLFTYELRRLGTDDRSSLGFPIDEEFTWEDNHLGMGLSSEKKTELKQKYEQQRNAHKS